tara:strand:+ start:634 stop:1077 length:444 start_codon:yes stop_codon:yes gene_type:complete
LFDVITTWHWLTLAVVLLILEVLGTSGFLLGIAVAAFGMAGIVALDLLPEWQHQLLVFSLLAVIFTLLYWKVFRGFNDKSAEPLLNDRAAQLIGRRLVLEETLVGGQGRIRVGDTLWKAEADDELEAGAKVEIFGSEGMTLKIRSIA